ncbi:MAG: tail fiber domain-containing protein, partial [bacterium]|nr:tail fiber domain-containing protein [bacterium]
IGDANVGRVWVKDRFGLGAVGVNGYVLNCAGQARFTDAVQFIGSDKAVSLNNGSYLNFANNGSIRRYTPDAIEGLYMAHNNFVGVSVGDVSNASNQYFMCDGLVNKTIFSKPIDVLGNIWSNGNLTATGDINFSGVDRVVNLVNNTSLNFNDTASIQKYTLVATSSLYLMDNNQITFHIGNDPSIASNSYMLIDGNNTKIFVYKAMECQSTFATNSIQTYSGSDININSHLNVNTANKIIMGDVEISYFETPAVVKRMNFTNTDKDLGVLSFDFGETPDVDITTVTMSYDNLSVFKPSFYYSNIVIDGGTLTTQDVVVSASNKINTRYIDSNAVLRLEASNSIDSYINGTKYLELDDTQFSSFNGFNLSSDRRLKDNIEDVDDDTINMVKNIKIKTFIKNQKTRKTELGWIAQDVQQYTNSKYNIVNDTGDYLTMCYDRMACISWDALSKLITRVEYLEEELFEKKKKKSK